MKTAAIAAIVILLTSVVGYLAMDRHDKNVATQKDKTFDDKFLKRKQRRESRSQMKTAAIITIVILLTSVVGYLADIYAAFGLSDTEMGIIKNVPL